MKPWPGIVGHVPPETTHGSPRALKLGKTELEATVKLKLETNAVSLGAPLLVPAWTVI